jgi:hypothetical protein
MNEFSTAGLDMLISLMPEIMLLIYSAKARAGSVGMRK